MPHSIDKNTLRSQLQQRRSMIRASERKFYSEKICQQTIKSSFFQTAQHIAFYTPVKGEANPLYLQKYSDKCFYLPLLSQQKKHHLYFVKIDNDTEYKKNIYGIPEPLHTAEDIIPIKDLDLVIMPLVAMDKKGNRLGMGGGYYDRSFAFKKNLDNLSKPILMGFAYDFQLVDHLTAEKWDVPLDYLVTNKTLIKSLR